MADISKINLPNDNNNPYNIDAVTVNGHTVDKDVPSNAKFTDTLFYFSIIYLFTTSDAYSYTTDSGSTTGYILITIKPETSWMLSFTLNLYGSYKAYSVVISGYNYGSNHWYTPAAQLLYSSDGATSKPVYFGYTGNWKLWVAVPVSSYQGVSITNITNGYTKITNRAADIFDISYVSSLPGTTQKTVNAVNNSVINLIYPVGSIYMSVNNTNPGNWLIGTTWAAWGSGRVPVGVNTSDTNFNTVEKTGGQSTVTLTASQSGVPQHTHALSKLTLMKSTIGSTKYGFATGGTFAGDIIVGQNTGNSTTTAFSSGTAGNNTAANASAAHTNLQPYITCYMWKRTA